MVMNGIGGQCMPIPLHRVHLECNLVSGPVTIGIVPSLPVDRVDLLLGNDLAGMKMVASPVVKERPQEVRETGQWQETVPCSFPECGMNQAKIKPAPPEETQLALQADEACLSETFFGKLEVPRNELNGFSLAEAQRADPALRELPQAAQSESEAEGVPNCYYLKNEVLMRKWSSPHRPESKEWTVVHQLVVLQRYRREILRMAHGIAMAVQVSIRKTKARIRQQFHWPKLHKDVVEYCRSCHMCQVEGKPQPTVKTAPLSPALVFGGPSSRGLVNCKGPPPRTKGDRQAHGCQRVRQKRGKRDQEGRLKEGREESQMATPTVRSANPEIFEKLDATSSYVIADNRSTPPELQTAFTATCRDKESPQ
ncbi:uncharacterized protein [Heterodontus francisci]|uniref:uncharacterized protein n=1 Tax=Heterodontus francisci TaxID=7792 RepID=UPI00355BBEDF